MSEDCTNDQCSSCLADCDSRREPAPEDRHCAPTPEDPESFLAKPHSLSRIGKVIGVVSGKGGVGKSLVTGLLASAMKRRGQGVGLMDADITGPSIPRLFGLGQRAKMDEFGLYPVKSRSGVDVMSINLLIENETDPVIWRGPVIGGMVKQFWTDVIWAGADYLFIDLPPGTGDVPLTLFQSIKLDGLVIVTSPQELVTMIVEKAVNMARMMKVPVLGLVENFSYFKCPDCGREVDVFGRSRLAETAARFGIPASARLPLDPQFAERCDAGRVDDIEGPWLDDVLSLLERIPAKSAEVED
ncbi:MAG: Mrp/NBP35 family ATP-binding protein [Candidatus Adiutrix sp.]|jgi:Mrp family chromosome partitioning ATPase|nr:Mrp/NBP35 family ATP-binding protein [Candidatus Adiutrix sp.]